MIEFYYLSGSPFAWRVWLALDFKGLNYPGHSSIYDPMGELITPENFIKEGVVEAILDYSELEGCRKQFRFLEDRDNFDLC